ncbi:MAG: hypothetical protein ACRCTL_01810 [Pseudomonas sp.]
MITVRPMTQADVAIIAAAARQADIDEMRDGAGVTVAQALQHGLDISDRCLVIMADDLPLAALGDSRHDDSTGVPWLVSTIHIERHARGFLRACRPLLADMLTRHPQLLNLIDARNTNAIRWLEWLGFRMSEPMPAGVRGLPFRLFTMTRG